MPMDRALFLSKLRDIANDDAPRHRLMGSEWLDEYGDAEVKQNGKLRIVVGATEVDFTGLHWLQPVTISHCHFSDYVDFSAWRCEGSLHIEDCTFAKGLKLADTQIAGAFSLKGTHLIDEERCWFDFRRMRVKQVFDASGLVAEAALDLANLQTDDDVWFYKRDVESEIEDKS